jgi:hypothetical protein
VKVSFPQRRTNLSQALPLQCGRNIIANYFPLSKDKIVKVKLRLIKGLSPTANDKLNTTLAVKHGIGQHYSTNSFQNKKFSEPNEIQSLKRKLRQQ